MQKQILLLSLFLMNHLTYGVPKLHEQWWEECLEDKVSIETFAGWLGNEDAPSRRLVRQHLMKMGYTSLLDIPCGLCTDYYTLKEYGITIEYYGIDITPKLVKRGVDQGINVKEGSIENIDMDESCVDICYARHILEHLDYYEQALRELIRVAKKEVLVVFFIRPHEKPDVINLGQWNGSFLYHNTYNKKKLETFIKSSSKVEHLEWEIVNKKEINKMGWVEIILHIFLKK